jgi:succinoglycan biosynthesis protein ExoA
VAVSHPIKRISIIVPMLNEGGHVTEFVGDVAAQDFAGEVELIVADGGSTDGSVEILRGAAERHGLVLELVDNPAGWVSQGLNACIERARGDLLVRLDCHSRYPADYLRLCARAAEETDAAVVGGIVVPHGRTPTERAVACAMDGPFGGIGWMRDTVRPVRRDSDVVTYGAFRPEAFRQVGTFDESLLRNQDDEFTLRLRRAGHRIVLDSSIKVHYTPRGSFRGVFRQYHQYGFWKVPVMRKHRTLPGPRSLVPPVFVLSLAALAPVAAWSRLARGILAAEALAYAACALGFAAASTRRRREPLRLVPRVAAVYPVFHLGYGLGVLDGLRSLLGWVSPNGRTREADTPAENEPASAP